MSEAEEEIASAFSFPDLPTVEQQIRAIEEPIRARYAEKIALDSEVVDEVLRTGSNRSKGQLRLIYNFMVEKTPEEYTEFVKNEYGTGGKGFESVGAKYAVWFDDLGLRIAAGDTAKGGTIANASLSWEDVTMNCSGRASMRRRRFWMLHGRTPYRNTRRRWLIWSVIWPMAFPKQCFRIQKSSGAVSRN